MIAFRCVAFVFAVVWLPLAAVAASGGYIKFDDIKGESGYQPSPDGHLDILSHHWGKNSPGTRVRTVVPVEPPSGYGHLTVSLPASASTRALEHYCGHKKLPALALFLPKAGGMGQYSEYRMEDVKVTCMPPTHMGGPNIAGPGMYDPDMGDHKKHGNHKYGPNKHGMAVQEFQFSYTRLKKQ